jgi:hypothetical protein
MLCLMFTDARHPFPGPVVSGTARQEGDDPKQHEGGTTAIDR